MCGRYSLSDAERQKFGERFLLTLSDLQAIDLRPRYNVAPGQDVVGILADPGGGRRPLGLRWGLVPPWSRDGRAGPINARAETAATKPMLRAALRARRCLIPADGFYEWRREGDRKVPMRFTLAGGGLFALAGIAERWTGPGGEALWSCAILTTAPNALVAPVHDRMPVILPPEHESLWLDPAVTGPAVLAAVCVPYPAEAMRAHAVSTRVNAPRNDGPDLIAPVA